jgi:glycosyltransferase involved in cell wall biosynthesis
MSPEYTPGIRQENSGVYKDIRMLISYFYPNKFHGLFVPYVKKHQFLHNHCTKEADLIYCGSTSQLDKALAAKQQYKKPLICWVWDLPCYWREWTRNNEEISAHARRDRSIEKTVMNLKKCDKIISGSKYTQRILKENYSIESEQIYFYIDTEGIDAIRANRRNGHIIQISRFALNKRFDISIKATNGLGRKLICAGTGNHSKLKLLAKELNADVEFCCNKNTSVIIALLKSAEILVSPSLHEGWGMTPIEAIHCGTPVLLSDLEVFKEIYGDNILYHKRDNPDDMREKLRHLLKDRRLQRKIISDCRPLIASFTVNKFIKRWERAIA